MNTNLTSSSSHQFRLAIASLLFALTFISQSHGQAGYYGAAYRGPAAAPTYVAYAQQAAYQRDMAEYQRKVAEYQQQLAIYNQQKAAYDRAMAQQAAMARPALAVPAARPAQMAAISYNGRFASASNAMPAQVQYCVRAANSIQNKPYRRGGEHGSVEDSAYDCSGSVSYVLIKAGLLGAPLPSNGFATYGQPGPGRYITIYVKPGEHVFMTVCGLRMDTSGGHDDEGPRWRAKPRAADGFIMRHPAGF